MIANKDIFLAIFPLSEQEVIELDSNSLLDDTAWDSMAKVMLISEMSETHDVVIEADALDILQTFKDLDELISSLI